MNLPFLVFLPGLSARLSISSADELVVPWELLPFNPKCRHQMGNSLVLKAIRRRSPPAPGRFLAVVVGRKTPEH
jgi:hypothetical protein